VFLTPFCSSSASCKMLTFRMPIFPMDAGTDMLIFRAPYSPSRTVEQGKTAPESCLMARQISVIPAAQVHPAVRPVLALNHSRVFNIEGILSFIFCLNSSVISIFFPSSCRELNTNTWLSPCSPITIPFTR
jgi:hypothetical protein